MKFEYSRKIEGQHHFCCFPQGMTANENFVRFVTSGQKWAERRGECERAGLYVLLIRDDDLAMEFRMRWC
jgi:hypothetical protein